jgi:tRNA (cytidine/uridine-2'-O-)-methyltransferase
MFAIVLVHPEIPPNTGNVIRLAANTGCELHLVEPLGFRLSDRELKRAGLDYHEYTRVRVHRDWPAAAEALAGRRLFAATTKAAQPYHALAFAPGDAFVFGCETAGLPPELLAGFPETSRLRVPMRPSSRSLNLSNAVAVVVYEAWRQQGFAGGV